MVCASESRHNFIFDFGSQKVPLYKKSKVTFNVHVFLRLHSCPTNYSYIFQKGPFLNFESTFYSQEDTFYASLEKQSVNNAFGHTLGNILTLKQIYCNLNLPYMQHLFNGNIF